MAHMAIIGSGIAGLTLANQFKGCTKITVFEKSRGVGGRMATRRATPFSFDHGVQFIKAYNPKFKSFLELMVDQGIIEPWHATFAELDAGHIKSKRIWGDELPHYVGTPAMNALPKYLSKDLHIELNTEVLDIKRKSGKWYLADSSNNDLGIYDWLVLAVPLSQALALLPELRAVESITSLSPMKACYALMLGIEHSFKLPFDVALVKNSCINLISHNSSKPGRDTAQALVIHADNDWSDAHIDTDETWVKARLLEETCKLLNQDFYAASYITLHRWRYANQSKQSGESYYLDSASQLGVCGDWFIQGKVEYAFLSGYQLSQELRKKMVDTSS